MTTSPDSIDGSYPYWHLGKVIAHQPPLPFTEEDTDESNTDTRTS